MECRLPGLLPRPGLWGVIRPLAAVDEAALLAAEEEALAQARRDVAVYDGKLRVIGVHSFHRESAATSTFDGEDVTESDATDDDDDEEDEEGFDQAVDEGDMSMDDQMDWA